MHDQRKPPIRSHRDLIVWQKAMDLAVEVYRITSPFPAIERYRLVDQLARAAASIPANIAEGRARSTRQDYRRFLAIAQGSLMEVDTFLLLSIRLGYLTSETTSIALSLLTEVSKMITTLRSRLKNP
jgi:four helix bundle protein